MKARHPVANHLRRLIPGQTQSFALPLKDRSGPLACDRLLRLLPGKRAAFYGHYGSDEVIAKLFFKRGRHRALCKRELDGLLALADSGCETPPILYTGAASDSAVTVLLLKWLPGAQSVLARWPLLSNDNERQQLLDALADVLARQHLGGVWQADLHLGNFLWHDDRIVCIDGDEVRRQDGPLSRALGFDNFALFCAQLPPRWDRLLAQAFGHYQRQRFGDTVLSWQAFLPAVQQHRRYRLESMLEKAGRSTTWLQTARIGQHQLSWQRSWQEPALTAFSEQPDQVVDSATQRLKDGNSATVVRCDWPQGPVVIKRYNLKSRWHACKRALQTSRAERSFKFAHALRLFEIDTPLPVACSVRKNGPFNAEAFYVSAAVDGVSLQQFLAGESPLTAAQQDVIGRVADLFVELRALQLVHGDTKASNILIRDGKPVLLDLDAMRQVTSNAQLRKRCHADMTRLLRNFAEQPDRAEAMAEALRARGLLQGN